MNDPIKASSKFLIVGLVILLEACANRTPAPAPRTDVSPPRPVPPVVSNQLAPSVVASLEQAERRRPPLDGYCAISSGAPLLCSELGRSIATQLGVVAKEGWELSSLGRTAISTARDERLGSTLKWEGIQTTASFRAVRDLNTTGQLRRCREVEVIKAERGNTSQTRRTLAVCTIPEDDLVIPTN